MNIYLSLIKFIYDKKNGVKMINNVNIANLNSNGLTTENLVSHKPKFDKSVFYNSTSSFIIPKDPWAFILSRTLGGVSYIGETKT